MPRKSDIRLGQLLIRRQWCSLTQVAAALQTRETIGSRRRSKPLWRVLVEGGHLDEDRVISALQELGALHMHCETCAWAGRIVELGDDGPGPCPGCGDPLVLSDGPKRSAAAKAGSRSTGQDVTGSHTANLGTPREGGSGDLSAVFTYPEGLVASSPEGLVASSNIAESGESGSAQSSSGGADPLVGRVFGGCRLTEKIARGGMGLGYKACQLNLNRTVAVKLLAEDLSRDRGFVDRFLLEARSAAQLNHHNVVHINDVGESGGVFYFTMEYVDGEDLRSILQRERRLAVDRALTITLQVCSALRHAHERGIVHRDIKPENIMITTEGVVKLADLGLAKRIEATNDGFTKAGSIFGTPYYMAPEQAKSFSDVDQRSDIYSLGVTLYKMISGKVPFGGRSPIEVLVKSFDGKRPGLRSVCDDVPEDVERIVDRMMARRPQDRYQDVVTVLGDLEELLGSLSSRKGTEKQPNSP